MKGDFIGFKFNGISNEELGIVRVSSGDRYDDVLLPEFEDKTIDIPGNDGQYYFNSDFNQKTFTINIAFDSLTEEELRKVKNTFSTKEIVPLVFEDRPYVTYYGKISNPPEFHYVCFDVKDLTKEGKTVKIKKSEDFPVLYPQDFIIPTTDEQKDGTKEIEYKKSTDIEFIIGKTYYNYDEDTEEYIEIIIEEGGELPSGEPSDYYEISSQKTYKYESEREEIIYRNKRIYKGEGSFTFICYFPFGRCNKKFLQEYKEKKSEEGEEPEVWEWKEEFKNGDEWAAASGLRETKQYGEQEIDKFENSSSGTDYQGYFWVYNPGDRETPPLITIPPNFLSGDLYIGILSSSNTRTIVIDPITLKGDDNSIVINCQNHLIEGKVGNTTSKNIYNEYIKRGDFFNIPYTEEPIVLYIKGSNVEGIGAEIQYDYLYI